MLTNTCCVRNPRNLMDDEIDETFLSPKLSDYCDAYEFQFLNTRTLLGRLVSLPECFYKGKKVWVTLDNKKSAALLLWDSKLTSKNKTSYFSVFVILDDASLVMFEESDGTTKHEKFSPSRIARESDRMCVNGVFYLHDLYDSIFEKRFIYPFKIDEGFPAKSPKFY